MWKLQINAELSCKWIVCSQFKEWCYLKLKKKTILPRSAKRNISSVIQMATHPSRPKKVGTGWSGGSIWGYKHWNRVVRWLLKTYMLCDTCIATWTWATYTLNKLHHFFQWSKECRLLYYPWTSTNRSRMCAEDVQGSTSALFGPLKAFKAGCAF